MSATGLEVFDGSLQRTNTWLDEVMADVGPDRHVAWHVLGAVPRTLRSRLPAPLAADLGAELPLIVRGAYYQDFRPTAEPLRSKDQDEFLEAVRERIGGSRPARVRDAVMSVFDVLSRHLDRGQCEKVREALPNEIKPLWHLRRGARAIIEGQGPYCADGPTCPRSARLGRPPSNRQGVKHARERGYEP